MCLLCSSRNFAASAAQAAEQNPAEQKLRGQGCRSNSLPCFSAAPLEHAPSTAHALRSVCR